MSRPKSELTKYILSLPPALPIPEVVKRAKEAGFETSPSNVHRVRKEHGAPAPKPPSPGPVKVGAAHSAPAAPKPPRGEDEGGSKAAFVRSLPRTMRARDVVARAKAAGIELNEKYVHRVRSMSGGKKRRKGGAAPAPAAAAPRAAAAPAAHAATPSSEVQFRKLVLDIGVSRARQLVDDVQKKVEALIRGH
jgi:hypothetical protein